MGKKIILFMVIFTVLLSGNTLVFSSKINFYNSSVAELDKINFNSTDGQSHLIEYLLEQCKPTKIVVQEFPYEFNIEKKY